MTDVKKLKSDMPIQESGDASNVPASSGIAEIDQLRLELEACQKSAADYLEGWKRAKADYANFERESAKRTARLLENETANVLMAFLTAYETLEQSLAHLTSVPEETKRGFVSTVQAFGKIFEGFGIVKIQVVKGQPIDPNLHEVQLLQKTEEVASGMIIQEVSSGYTLNGKLLKAAKVIVAE
ncbi:MAG TPA: nucleotide exchange factor GrpE [Patescibacteria group bacterium]|nr:nucleotide exchange factor GrpE [Patescibacteria group bacterium]